MKTIRQNGSVLPLVAVSVVILLLVFAFVIDLGWIYVTRINLQTTANAAAIAGAHKMVELKNSETPPSDDALVAAIKAYSQSIALQNKAGNKNIQLRVEDIIVGTLSGDTVTSNPKGLSVQVTAQLTSVVNGPLALFLGGVTGKDSAALTAKAIATITEDDEGNIIVTRPDSEGGEDHDDEGDGGGGDGDIPDPVYDVDPEDYELLIPYAMDEDKWDDISKNMMDSYAYDNDEVSPGTDGVFEVNLFPTFNSPGNFGTINIGGIKDKDALVNDQTVSGVSATDVANYINDYCKDEIKNGKVKSLGFISQYPDHSPKESLSLYDNSGNKIGRYFNGEPGISNSSDRRAAWESIVGEKRIIALYDKIVGTGNNSDYHVVAYVTVRIMEVNLTGNPKVVIVQPVPIEKQKKYKVIVKSVN